MDRVLEKQCQLYLKTYLRRFQSSWAVNVNRVEHLMKELAKRRVVECRGHPSFDKVKSCETVKCGKVWVVLGRVEYEADGSLQEASFEMALGIDKNELDIWWDLNSSGRH